MIKRFLCAVFTALSFAAQAAPLEIGQGALPVSKAFSPPLQVSAQDQLVIEGHITAAEPKILVLRVDDAQSTSYATRLNDERRLPPGDFVWKLPLKGLKTSGGRILNVNEIKQMTLFAAEESVTASLKSFRIEPAPKLPEGALGLSFGDAGAPLFSGFERVTAQDSRLSGSAPTPIRRPGVDALLTSGLRGFARISVPYPAGMAHVTLWSEDLGEWETLPNALNRRIRINGKEVFVEKLTPKQWLTTHYFAGAGLEAAADFDPWALYGARRGGKIEADVEIGSDGLNVELAGESPAATYLSAILIEPGPQHPALDRVEQQQAEDFRSFWRRADIPDMEVSGAPHFDLAQPPGSAPPQRLTLAANSGGRLRFTLTSKQAQNIVSAEISPPMLDMAHLDVQAFAAQWRAERIATNSNLLVRKANMLHSRLTDLGLAAGDPRLYELWISAPPNAPAGVYSGKMTLTFAQRWIEIPLEVEVLPIELPRAPRPAGFYLDEAPHLTYFAETHGARAAQIGCDLDTFRRFGISGTAPPLSTPRGDLTAFLADTQIAVSGSVEAPWLAYAPAKRMLSDQGAGAVQLMKQTELALMKRGLPSPVWSIADEPSNPDQGAFQLDDWAKALRKELPDIRLAGHLNAPQDQKFLPLFDTVLINGGYGLDVDTIEALKTAGKSVWLYNTDFPRLSAGAWAWRSGAEHYLQWHARMPTADPYDPTDGREGDVQIFYPQPEVCAQTLLGRDIFDMAEGLVDQRWLEWLDMQNGESAFKLQDDIRHTLGKSWEKARKLPTSALDAMREKIIALARNGIEHAQK